MCLFWFLFLKTNKGTLLVRNDKRRKLIILDTRTQMRHRTNREQNGCDRDMSEEQRPNGQQADEAENQQKRPLKRRALCGAATYRCTFNNEWTKKWPFISTGSLSTHYWCSVCQVENTCSHQGVTDIERHNKSKSHLQKQQCLQSNLTTDTFAVAFSSVASMSNQEVKVCWH